MPPSEAPVEVVDLPMYAVRQFGVESRFLMITQGVAPATAPGTDRVIRPAAILNERDARAVMAWLDRHDVTNGGVWAHDVSYIKRFSGPFDGPSGMRGSAVLLGSIYITWDNYLATIYRVSITDEGVAAGLSVEHLCNDVLQVVGLTITDCPRAAMADAPAPDPFRRRPPDVL